MPKTMSVCGARHRPADTPYAACELGIENVCRPAYLKSTSTARRAVWMMAAPEATASTQSLFPGAALIYGHVTELSGAGTRRAIDSPLKRAAPMLSQLRHR